MKKGILFILTIVGMTSLSLAQSLVIADYDAVTYVNSMNVQDYGSHIEIANISSSPVQVKVIRKVFDDNLCAFDSTYYCWDYCYTNDVDSSDGALPIAANDTDHISFSGHVFSSNMGSTCVDSVRYTFFVEGSPNDSASVILKYSAGPTIGVNENEVAVAKSYPNPASDVFFVEFANQPKSNTSIELYNLLGTKVQQIDVTSMRTEINVSNLTSGIYIYSVSRNGKTFETKKVVVKH